VYWVDTAEGHHCTRHDFAFERGEVCRRCETDPGEEPGGIVEIPEYQQALKSRIAEYESRSKACWKECNDMRGGTDREGNTAVKWSAEALKWARLAEERREVLERREHNLELIRHEREMSGLRRGN
jgi:hypothetical protein